MNEDKILPERATQWFVSPALAVLLALLTAALYWPATRCNFIDLDDQLYVTENVQVQHGLTVENLQWVFLNPVCGNWHPLTMLSHMLDCQLYGLKPFGHHLTSLLLHALNTALVFLLLRRLTGATWRSAVVAALFGWHPLHVESVAWVAERKDVLSTCFGLLSLICYVRYARAKTGKRPPAVGSYWLALLCFALGLMSKAMLVTWPFVMLLLDFWPLKRISDFRFPISGLKNLLLEKLPFFVLATAVSIVTFEVQQQVGAVKTMEVYPLDARIGNAMISYCRYLEKIFWPSGLAIYYPHHRYWAPGLVLAAGLILSGVTWIFYAKRNRHPFLLTGWLWFVGTLVPVIGLVQVGEQAMADRYTYFPSLGVFILVIWGAYELTRRLRCHTMLLSAVGFAAIILCITVTRRQLGYWRNGESLSRHALAVTENNSVIHYGLGVALLHQGRIGEAMDQFREAIRLAPDFVDAHIKLGVALLRQGRTDEALDYFQRAVQIQPDSAQAQNNLGGALLEKGRADEALVHFQRALQIQPDSVQAHNNLGNILAQKGDADGAIAEYQQALRIQPDDWQINRNLGNILFYQKGRVDEAMPHCLKALEIRPDDALMHTIVGHVLLQKGRDAEAMWHYQKALQLDPASVIVLNNLAWILATSHDANLRNGVQAVKYAERACGMTKTGVPAFVAALAAAYAEAGRYRDAVAAAQRACALAEAGGQLDLLGKIRKQLELYQSGRPYHQEAKASP